MHAGARARRAMSEPPGSRPGRGRSKESSRNPSRMPSRGGLSAPSGKSSVDGEDWDAMVKSFLKAEIERTEQRQEWLRKKLEAAKDLAEEDTRGDGYQVRAARRSGRARRAGGPRRERVRGTGTLRATPPPAAPRAARCAPRAPGAGLRM